jgi:hypothetical protein
MSRNALRATAYVRIPAERVFEVGVQVERDRAPDETLDGAPAAQKGLHSETMVFQSAAVRRDPRLSDGFRRHPKTRAA